MNFLGISSGLRGSVALAIGSMLLGCGSSSTEPGDAGTASTGAPSAPAEDPREAGAATPHQAQAAPGDTCGVTATDTCTACARTSCCDATRACATNGQCQPLLKCIAGCASGDVACRSGCTQQYPNGTSALEAFVGCMQTSCPSVCN
jgi:hypothetical protein